MTTQPPSKIGRYRIERELGRGTMGIVYEAVDTTLGRTVALKTFGAMAAIAPHEREAFEQRFLSEARISATLEDPHVVAVFDVGRDFETGLLYMALEYVRGETLANALSRGPMPWNEAASIVAKVAKALQAAHAHHIVHRDIKPANIMLTPSGEPKIMDFGIAKASAAQLTVAGQVFGTPAYMSPEQATGEDVDGRSDIFALGAVLFELVTNTRPFEGPTMQATLTRILREEPRPASSFGHGIPRALDSIVARALRKGRDSRYDSAAHMAADLQCLLDGKPLLHATQLSPLETVALLGGSGVRRPATPVRVPVIEPDLPAESVREKSSFRMAAAIGVGIAVGVAVVLMAQQANKTDASGMVAEPSFAAASKPLPAPAAITPPAATPVPTLPPRAGSAFAPVSAAPISVEASGPPAKVSLDVRYPFASASLRVLVDGQVVFTSSLHAMPIKNSTDVTGYDGRFGTDLMIPPGDHEMRVELRSGSMAMSEATRIRAASRSTHQLSARVVDNVLTLALN